MTRSDIFERVQNSSNRLIIINETGVLTHNKKDNAYICTILNELASIEGIILILVSPKSKKELDEQYGKNAPNLCLAAEYGIFLKSKPRRNGEIVQWEELIP